ncbi:MULTISPECIES: hypothetical protein [unclassified Streptomyces]|uniref:hypothetical protein n=1 Tax=unclassified Streptomyces TaxID=2593676 RepID=UPI002023CE37|nr:MULTISPECIES: hypothetical protein [unclassified Streptomyces]MCX4549181.1 hypothetical protein [Streptomyces sp. NBC_01500]WSC20752.1 hypothetical protein OIE60_14220 [Streptomyces sp. NBC_01766]WSV54780.1 hypothetical protein OG282_14265 [Streptomyces sp. NBC_01014]
MPFEDELGTALHRAADTFEPADRPALVDGGLRIGRRRAVRRRAAAVTGSVLALALVGSAGAYAAGLFGGAGGGGRASVAVPPVETAKPGHGGAISGAQMVSTLKGLLPAGEFSRTEGRGTSDGLGPLAYGVFDDGKGKSAISLSVGRVAAPGAATADNEQVTCPDKALARFDACHAERLADGSRLMILQGYEYPDGRADTKDWTATLRTPDGLLVQVSEWNAAQEKDAPVSRPEPPLSPALLKALVTADAWRAVGKAVPVPKPEKAPPVRRSPGASGKDIGAALRSLLPHGVKVTGSGGQQEEYAYVTVDDGKGGTFVQINVQPNMADVADELVANGQHVETLDDGTKVITSKEPGEKGGAGVVQWTADTLRPDGFRVVVMEMNTATLQGPATRKAPALTMEQLRSIAVSDAWLKLRGA